MLLIRKCWLISSASVTISQKQKMLVVCTSKSFRYVLTQCQGGKTPETILEKRFLMAINLGRSIWPFLNNLSKFILQSEIVLSSGNNCQFLQEWTSHQIYHKVRICNCQRNLKMRKRNFKKTSFCMLNIKVYDSTFIHKTGDIWIV